MLEEIKTLLEKEFAPATVFVADQSLHHKNHPQAKHHGGGHFDVAITSPQFVGHTSLARHRLIYKALDRFFTQGAIHALAIKKATTPAEEGQA